MKPEMGLELAWAEDHPASIYGGQTMGDSRLDAFIGKAEQAGADIAVISAGPNLKYLLGLVVDPHERAFLMITGKGFLPSFVLPMLEMANVGRAAAEFGAELHGYSDEEGPYSACARAMRHAASKPGKLKVGAEFLHMRLKEHELIRSVLGGFEVIDIDGLLTEMRAVKDPCEIASLRRAAEIVDIGVAAARASVRPGASEKQVAAQIERAMLDAGADSVPFNIVLAGPNAALPHGVPSDRRIMEGDLVICDIGASYKGYFADITRTIPAGRPSEELMRAYDAVYRANEAGRKAARPGMECGDLDAACRKVIEDAGFGELFIHRTGHGLGLEVHEEPYIVGGSIRKLLPGMVFTIEPGIYIPGVGGVRIEDDAVITETGADILTKQPRELTVG